MATKDQWVTGRGANYPPPSKTKNAAADGARNGANIITNEVRRPLDIEYLLRRAAAIAITADVARATPDQLTIIDQIIALADELDVDPDLEGGADDEPEWGRDGREPDEDFEPDADDPPAHILHFVGEVGA